MKEELAVIEDAEFGCLDTNNVMLWFNVRTLSGVSTQALKPKVAVLIMEKHRIKSVHQMNRMPCVVETDGDIVRFVRLFKESRSSAARKAVK